MTSILVAHSPSFGELGQAMVSIGGQLMPSGTRIGELRHISTLCRNGMALSLF